MNDNLLALIADLYGQMAAAQREAVTLREENEQLRAALGAIKPTD